MITCVLWCDIKCHYPDNHFSVKFAKSVTCGVIDRVIIPPVGFSETQRDLALIETTVPMDRGPVMH